MTTTSLLALLLCHTAIVASAAAAPPSPTAGLPVAVSSSDSTSRTPNLRFDLMQEEQVADAAPSRDTLRSIERHYIYKLNRKRATAAQIGDVATLWSVRRVAVKRRTVRLSDSMGWEKVQLLKFFVERDPRKGSRPHLLGNVGGCSWSQGAVYDPETRTMRRQSPYITQYTLRGEFDTTSYRQGGEIVVKRTPRMRELGADAVYLLHGKRVPGLLFRFCEGLILQTLEIRTDTASLRRYGTATGVVLGELYPDRQPLVVLNGRFTDVGEWMNICRSGAFAVSASVPMYYFFMQPLEAVQTYGKQGQYGAICISYAE